MLWIFATLLAAGAQTARNAMQSSLTATLGTLGATQVRFLYGLPFAVVFLALAAAIAGTDIPAPTWRFFAAADYTAGTCRTGGTHHARLVVFPLSRVATEGVDSECGRAA